ncbi:2-hydroxyacid dehydrogenase [Brucella sp. NBRC 12950]|jgi:D-3-phosphoglycerate dehydrogenase|uniref:2-hydroxyacid dehydrogenase n=1 Tax=Brucella sp. NBRC 12950 TaxID=2994518 RepID=UPI0024A2CBCA|nr:2-hydroxyacid dehydrogenase [Brucella sp. NBRC 12950]GLU25397.1 oxidoreductase [Brucella sp. NBRC 12950]
MSRKLVVIGDHFMLPEIFEEKLREACGDGLDIRSFTQDWPDRPMEHGYAVAGMDGLKEYMGSADEVVSMIGDAEILVTQLAPMSRTMLDRLPGLKMIAVTRGGPVNIDMKAARDRGIRVVNAPGRNASAVAEFTLGAILAETRKIRVGHEALRQGVWRGDLYRADTTGRELSEMTVGVVGYGQIGSRVVRLLRAFGAKVIVHDPYVQLNPADAADGVELVDFDRLLADADLVTMHPRVTEETTGMMNATSFAKMKAGAIFVNTARGPLCDYDALTEALMSGHLSGAMLETFGVEPVPADWPLLKLDNVTLTPHIAGASVRTVTFAAEQAAEEVRRYIAGEPAWHLC